MNTDIIYTTYAEYRRIKINTFVFHVQTHTSCLQIREKFDSGEDVELTDDINPHDVACLLKEFFRSLPEALLTKDLYQPFLSTQSKRAS